jgi:hypothetical protein
VRKKEVGAGIRQTQRDKGDERGRERENDK